MKRLLTAVCLLSVLRMYAEEPADTFASWRAEGIATLSSGSFAPHYLVANRFGIVSSGDNYLLSAKVERDLDKSCRFSYAFGVQFIGGYTSEVVYRKFDKSLDGFVKNPMTPSRAYLQQLYAAAKWRSLFFMAGMKEFEPALVDRELSSGDLIHSGNIRPIPQVRAGFVDFQPVPFTSGKLKIQGEFAYGKFTDAKWGEKHSDHYNSFTTSGIWYVYRRLYFRLDTSRLFSLTFGAQAAGQFGGKSVYMKRGEVDRVDNRGIKFVDFFKMIVPMDVSKEGFCQGNTLGSWDIKADFRLKSGMKISGYVEFPWEDGSGMAKLNGFDGLYGVVLSIGENKPALEAAAVEYLDLTNQSGPIHFDPDDYAGTNMTSQATGADDYYNNKFYNSYSNYGMIAGTPMVMGPIYNLDGYNCVIGNRMRGVHVAARGWLHGNMSWEAKFGWRKAYGNGFMALVPPRHSYSALASFKWYVPAVKNLTVKGSLALDRGKLPANTFGAEISVAYSGVIFSRDKR
ncbi:MAG: capsule assembly Wzi family protein [Paramuribaculum sp.]|nr:capsule assembly Wzi family protein [Paramuribaculum sp.]